MQEHLVQDRNQERERTRGREQEIEPVEYRGLTAFKQQQPPRFLGGFDPEGGKIWISGIEKIFWAMACLEEHKVNYATYMLSGEAET